MRVFARTPLDLDRKSVPRGQVFLLPERCKGCEICIRLCPMEVLQISNCANQKGYHYPEVVPGKEGDCVNCEFCMLVCPEFAIFTAPNNGKIS